MSQEALRKFLQQCDPSLPATGSLYVANPTRAATRIVTHVRHASQARLMFVGQTGVGKTTELMRAGEMLKDEFLIVMPPLDVLDARLVDWHDILVFSALWAAEANNLFVQARWELLKALQHEEWVPEWFADQDDGGEEMVQGAGVPPPRIAQRFKNEHAKIKEFIAQGPAQIWDLATALLRRIETEFEKPIVLLFDGLERVGEDAGKRLFSESATYISDLPTRAIMTAPMWLTFQGFFSEVEEQFVAVERIRAVDPDGADSAFLDAIARARGAMAVCDETVLQRARHLSGGLVRQFLSLLSTAGTIAIMDQLDNVPIEVLERARHRAADRWQYALSPADFAELRKHDAERDPQHRWRLLRVGALVEHDTPDGGFMVGVNPIVADLMERRSIGASK